MHIETIVVGSFQVNCYLVWCAETLEGLVIDPGAEGHRIIDAIEESGMNPVAIVNTHGHGDHIAANGALKEQFGIPLRINGADAAALGNPWENASALFGFEVLSPPADDYINSGDIVRFGKEEMEVLSTPGHTPGGISLYSAAHKAVFVGDALFQSSIGRTDLPGGDTKLLLESIKANLLSLPDDTRVYPGHGPPTTIGAEKRANPYVSPRTPL